MTIYNGDCTTEQLHITSGSVDMVLTDLPYGTMKGAQLDGWADDGLLWDDIIEPIVIHNICNRVLRMGGKMVLFGQQPFTTNIINTAITDLPHLYNMIWEKDHFANSLIAKKAPVSYFEDIMVFGKKYDHLNLHPLRAYFKNVMLFLDLKLKDINRIMGHRRAEHSFYINSTQFGLCTTNTYQEIIELFNIDKMNGFMSWDKLKEVDNSFRPTFNLPHDAKYKSNILKYKKDYTRLHPTQKPVLLLEDLIKTFTNEGDTVVDLTMGSGTTAIACQNTNRKFIGIELDDSYYEIAKKRIMENT